MQNIVAEQKLRTQRILGVLLKNAEKNKGAQGIGINQYSEVRLPQETAPKLNDYGLNKKQSSTFQQIASIPEETFKSFIQEKTEVPNNAVKSFTSLTYNLIFITL